MGNRRIVSKNALINGIYLYVIRACIVEVCNFWFKDSNCDSSHESEALLQADIDLGPIQVRTGIVKICLGYYIFMKIIPFLINFNSSMLIFSLSYHLIKGHLMIWIFVLYKIGFWILLVRYLDGRNFYGQESWFFAFPIQGLHFFFSLRTPLDPEVVIRYTGVNPVCALLLNQQVDTTTYRKQKGIFFPA